MKADSRPAPFLGAIFRPEDGPFFGGAPPFRVMRAGARACHDDACCNVDMFVARYTFSPRASSVPEGPMMATGPCVARSRGASSCALCEDLGYIQCAASLPPQPRLVRIFSDHCSSLCREASAVLSRSLCKHALRLNVSFSAKAVACGVHGDLCRNAPLHGIFVQGQSRGGLRVCWKNAE